MFIYKLYNVSGVDASCVARRPRESPYPIISVEEALNIVLENSPVLEIEQVTLTGKFTKNNHLSLAIQEPIPLILSSFFHHNY